MDVARWQETEAGTLRLSSKEGCDQSSLIVYYGKGL